MEVTVKEIMNPPFPVCHLPLSTEEVSALREYAKEHGRCWKRKLRIDWMYARTSGILQRLRNVSYFGPDGLIRFRLKDYG